MSFLSIENRIRSIQEQAANVRRDKLLSFIKSKYKIVDIERRRLKNDIIIIVEKKRQVNEPQEI